MPSSLFRIPLSRFFKTCNNTRHYNYDGLLKLNLSCCNIKDISEIEGLDSLSDLWFLGLYINQITEIKGLAITKTIL